MIQRTKSRLTAERGRSYGIQKSSAEVLSMGTRGGRVKILLALLPALLAGTSAAQDRSRDIDPATAEERGVRAVDLSESQREQAAIWGRAGESRSREMAIDLATRMAPLDLWFGVP